MTTRFASILILVFTTVVGFSSHAQVSARPDPGDTRLPVIPDKPESAFNAYTPFREQPVRSWKDANQEVADNPGMGSMANMPGMNMTGTNQKEGAVTNAGTAGAMTGVAGMPGMSMPAAGSTGAMAGMNMPGMNQKGGAVTNAGAAGAMTGMAGMPGMSMPAAGSTGAMAGMNMPGKDSKGAAAAHGKSESAMPRMGAIPAKGTMPGMNMASAESETHHGHGGATKSGGSMLGMAMPGMGSKTDESESAILAGTGVVREVDKPRGRIKLTHDPIEAVSWPRMTIVFRVKSASLVDQVRPGDKVKFVLTKSSTGFVISDIGNVVSSTTNQTK